MRLYASHSKVGLKCPTVGHLGVNFSGTRTIILVGESCAPTIFEVWPLWEAFRMDKFHMARASESSLAGGMRPSWGGAQPLD